MKAVMNKILTAVLTLSMMCALALGTWASAEEPARVQANAPGTSLLKDDTELQNNLAVTKQLKTVAGVEFDDVSVSFHAKLKKVNGVAKEQATAESWDNYDSSSNWEDAYPDFSKTINVGEAIAEMGENSEDRQLNDGLATYYLSTGLWFQPSNGNIYINGGAPENKALFPHPGVYSYEITESVSGLKANGTDGLIREDDSTVYTMNIYVVDDTSAETQHLSIRDIVVRNASTGEKVDIDTTYKQENGVMYTNKYYPAPTEKDILTVTKELLGGNGENNQLTDADRSHGFTFQIELMVPSSYYSATGFNLKDIKLHDKDEKVVAADVVYLSDADAGLDEEDKVSAVITTTINSESPLYFDNIPIGTRYTVTETDATVADYNDNKMQYYSLNKTFNGVIDSDKTKNTGTVTNTKQDVVVITGLLKEHGLWLFGVVAALLLGAFFALNWRKQEE